MRKVINTVHLEGLLYQHQLVLKTSGEKSKNPGTQFISGTIDVATDDALTNIVSVHYTYVTAKTNAGAENRTFTTLQNIINGTIGSVMEHGADKAAKLRIDTSIGLNEFYSTRTGTEELVSVKRNEGGFVHTTQVIANKEELRNTFKADMIIVKAKRFDANEENNRPEYMTLSGYVFDFRNALLPVDFTVYKPQGMDYFADLEPSEKTPVFTQVWGHQASRVIVNRREIEAAFGEPIVEESTSTQREFIVDTAINPYAWDDEGSITAVEYKEALQNRNLYLAGVKQRQDEYNAERASSNAQTATPPSANGFNF